MLHTVRRAASRVRVVAASVGVVVGVALLGGCADDDSGTSDVTPLAQIASEPSPPAENGIDQLEPAEALATSIEAMSGSGTFTVKGTTSAGSTLDMAFRAGVGTRGSVTTDSVVQIVAVDGSVYVTGDPATIAEKVGADVDETIADKWLLVPQDTTSSFAIFISADAFAESVLGSNAPDTISSVTDVDGKPAVGLLFPATGATLWVSATGDPVPLRFEEKGATAGKGVLTFGDYGADVSIAAPDPKTVVDPSSN